MTLSIHQVLFLCTGNSARSIMAEAILTAVGRGRFRGFSAGSHPTGAVNPLAIETLAEMDVPTAGLRSKSWDEFAAAEAPRLDFVVTVCDRAAAEACPYWPGHPATAHWGVEDPAAVVGSPAEKKAAFRRAALLLRRRIEALAALPLESLDGPSLTRKLEDIGRLQ